MEAIYNLAVSNFKFYLAFAFRTYGLLFTTPCFRHRTAPFFFKSGLVFFISLILLSVSISQVFSIPDLIISYLIPLAIEALVGGLFGLLFYLLSRDQNLFPWQCEPGGKLERESN